ncbi:MAG: hypothetical protein ACO1TH_25760 [Luteitalea sp.]
MSSVLKALVMSCVLSILASVAMPCHAQRTPDAGAAMEGRRAEIARAFETLGSDPSQAAIVEQALTDAEPALRLAAVGGVLNLVQPGPVSVGPDLCLAGDFDWFPPSVARLADAVSGRLHDVDPKVRAAAIGVVNSRAFMPQLLRAACASGARGAMSVEMAPQGYLPAETILRLMPLVGDPDRDVRSTALWALVSGAPVNHAYVDLVFEAAKERDRDDRASWHIGIARVREDVELAVAVVERVATAPLALRGYACKSIALWDADASLLDSLLLWDAQESDATTKSCLHGIVGWHKQRLDYLKANAPALARVRALYALVEGVQDVARAAPQVREALRDPDALVREAGLRLVVAWTIGQLEFAADTPTFEGLGMPAMRTLTLDDFQAEIVALMDDPKPGLQGVALELFSKANLMRTLGPQWGNARTGDAFTIPTLSPAVVTRFSKVPSTADPSVRQVAARVLLRYAPVDATYLDRVLDGLTSADAKVVEEAASSISRIGSDQTLLTTFTSRMRRLPAGARRQAVHGVAGLMVEGESYARLEAWANAEADSDVGRDLRALLDQLTRP